MRQQKATDQAFKDLVDLDQMAHSSIILDLHCKLTGDLTIRKKMKALKTGVAFVRGANERMSSLKK